MNCPICFGYHKDNLLHCPHCLARQSYRAFLEQQKTYLPDVLAGRFDLRLIDDPAQLQPHVALYGNRRQAWCGASLTPRKDDRRVKYTVAELNKVCRSCWEKFEQLRKELA